MIGLIGKAQIATTSDLMYVLCSMLQSLGPNPCCFCVLKVINLYKYVHSHYKKE
jgi:hypothetical protein